MTDETLFRECRDLERYGYVFRVTSREWLVAYNPDADHSGHRLTSRKVILHRVKHYEDDGGSSSRDHEALGKDNLTKAVAFAYRHVANRLAEKYGRPQPSRP